MNVIPCYAALSEGFRSILKSSDENVSVSMIYSMYVSNWDFDESWYIENYPDLNQSIPSDVFKTGRQHFASVGYSEGRLPFHIRVDTSWYMSEYPDVASAVIKGAIESAAQHFIRSGYREGRLPAAPDFDVRWYARTYLPKLEQADALHSECFHHYKHVGYLNGALPRLKTL